MIFAHRFDISSSKPEEVEIQQIYLFEEKKIMAPLIFSLNLVGIFPKSKVTPIIPKM